MDEATAAGTVEVHLWAAAREAAGTGTAVVPAGTVAEVLAALEAAHPAKLAEVLPRCSLLLDEVAVHDHSTPAPPGARLDVLPPFAGG